MQVQGGFTRPGTAPTPLPPHHHPAPASGNANATGNGNGTTSTTPAAAPAPAAATPEAPAEGRVHVFARVRPCDLGATAIVDIDDTSNVLKVRNDSDAMERILGGLSADAALSSAETRSFNFDGVFSSKSNQREVFLRVGLPVLRESLKGINGTILAYGQTGSGKTHSLLNQGIKTEEAGLLPRLIASLFLQVAQDVDNVYSIEAAAVQVYNEQVDDLLHLEHQAGSGRDMQIRNNGVIPGLTWVTCKRPETMLEAFARARTNLVYAETKLNKASSRSHAIFQIRLSRRERSKAPAGAARQVECVTSRLCVVDLAGSERVKKSGAEGAQFKEATNINRSLLAFGNVVSALAAKKAHVPLRDSKLTRILDGSIGGNCKTALLVCASPLAEHSGETLNALDFASRAMRVEVNARVNTSIVEVCAKTLLSDLSEDADGLGGMPLSAELLELRRRSAELAEKAQVEAKRKDQALLEAEKQARKLQEMVESAEKKGKSWKAEADSLRQSSKAATGEAETLRQNLAKWEKRANELEKAAQTSSAEIEKLKTQLKEAEKSAKEWQQSAEQRLAESKSEAVKKEAAAVKQQKEEVTKMKIEAQTMVKEANVKSEETQKVSKEFQNRAEAAEKNVASLKKQLETLESSLAATREEADSVRKNALKEAEEARAKASAEAREARAKATAEVEAAVSEASQLLEEERVKADEALADKNKELEDERSSFAELQASLEASAAELAQRNFELEEDVLRQTEALKKFEHELTEANNALEELKMDSDSRVAASEKRLSDGLARAEAEHSKAIEELQTRLEKVVSEAEKARGDDQKAHQEELQQLEQEHQREKESWERDRERMEVEHARAMEDQRRHFEALLAATRSDYEAKLHEMQEASSLQLDELQSKLEEEMARYEEEKEKWKTMKEAAIQEAWEKGSAQHRRLASAFKAARCINAQKEEELQARHNDLAQRFASRESREDDVAEIERQKRALENNRRALMQREGEVKGLSLALRNRDETDRIFSQSEFRNRRRGGPIVPALPGKTLGDRRCFKEREHTRMDRCSVDDSSRANSASPLHSQSHHASHSSGHQQQAHYFQQQQQQQQHYQLNQTQSPPQQYSPMGSDSFMNRTCPGGFSSSARASGIR